MNNIDKREAQIFKTLYALEKQGFRRQGDVYYSPEVFEPVKDGRPPWAEQTKKFSRVRSLLFVL